MNNKFKTPGFTAVSSTNQKNRINNWEETGLLKIEIILICWDFKTWISKFWFKTEKKNLGDPSPDISLLWTICDMFFLHIEIFETNPELKSWILGCSSRFSDIPPALML